MARTTGTNRSAPSSLTYAPYPQDAYPNQDRRRQTTARRSPESVADARERRRRILEERRQRIEAGEEYRRPEARLREGSENQPRGDSIGRRSYPDSPPRSNSTITVGDSLPMPEDLFPELPGGGAPEQGGGGPLTASLFAGGRWPLILGAGALLGGILLYNQMSS
jgi:hypothetical protein